ncbi:MAG: phosphatase PAP2 family protein [Succiniclasticum sp.]|jgi:membrane-associated phospholipid phosphatase
MLQAIAQLDYQILFWIQENLRSDTATVFWEFITDLGNMSAFWIVIAIALLIFKKTRATGVAVTLSVALNGLIANGILKVLVARPRPFMTYADITPLISHPSGYSFPSGHTACAFAVAFVLYQMLPRRYGIPAMILAFLIGLSRLYLGVHYPTDVLGGMLIGCAIAKLAVPLMRKLQEYRIRILA